MDLAVEVKARPLTVSRGNERSKPSILLVDDHPENLLALESLLEPMDYDLHRATSGEDALRKVLRNDFAVILLDVQMPGMDGFEIAGLIKTRQRSRGTPIIFVTAINKDREYVFHGYDVGAVDYLFKPLQPEILRGKVRAFVDLYHKTEQVRRQEKLLREAAVREQELNHRAEMLASQAKTRQIIESVQEAVVTFGEDRSVDLLNPAAARKFGRPAPHGSRCDLRSLFTPESLVDLERLIACSTGGSANHARARPNDGSAIPGAHAPDRLIAITADGSTFPVEASVSRLDLPDGTVYTLIARDVSERDRYEAELREQARALKASRDGLERLNSELQSRQNELERAMRERTRFYASMSHELRTPINAIMGYQELLISGVYGEIDARQEDPLKRIERSTRHLLDLINDVLDLSKIGAGKLDLQPEQVHVPDIVRDLFATVRPLAQESGSELRFEADGSDMRITTDARRISQILLNLLSNAVKFGEGKPIVVRCEHSDDGTVCVLVADSGRGIPADQLDSIFQEFVQLESPTVVSGTGLGLAISRNLAEHLGGRLEVESEVGRGSVFRLFLRSLDPLNVPPSEVAE
jgi:signal transduction histidine kinase/CheY-like chemotaxis protein